jgi:hypothetical protein
MAARAHHVDAPNSAFPVSMEADGAEERSAQLGRPVPPVRPLPPGLGARRSPEPRANYGRSRGAVSCPGTVPGI